MWGATFDIWHLDLACFRESRSTLPEAQKVLRPCERLPFDAGEVVISPAAHHRCVQQRAQYRMWDEVHVSLRGYSGRGSKLCTNNGSRPGASLFLSRPHEHCKVAGEFWDFAWGLICCQLSRAAIRAAICACLATGVCVGSVALELWVMRGTCSWSALLLQISETSTVHWLQSAQVSWLGLCGPETSPWSAVTSLLASIECHADDRQTRFHPFSLVGFQG